MKHFLLDKDLEGYRMNDPLESKLNQLILDNLPYAVVSCRLPDFSFEYVNPATLDLLGYSREEFLDHSALDLVHPEDMDLVEAVIAANLPSAAATLKFAIARKTVPICG